jgi:putative transcriptional regulator
MAKAKQSKLTKAFLETAGDMKRVGVSSKAAYKKITMRHLGNTSVAALLSAKEIKIIRKHS